MLTSAAPVLLLVFLSVAPLACIVYVMVKTHLAVRRFLRESRGTIKFAPGLSLLFGHLKSFTFKPDVNNELAELHARLGSSFCAMFGSRPAVISIDLDLIKQIVLDEQDVHTSRGLLDTPIKEQMVDNIFTCKGEQHRRLRRAIAPALRTNKFKTPEVEAKIERCIDKLVHLIEWKLDQQPDGQVTLQADDYSHRYSLDLVLNCFYKQDDRVDFRAHQDKLVHVIDSGLEAMFSSPFALLSATFGFLNPLFYAAIKHLDPLGAWQQEVVRFIELQTGAYLAAKQGKSNGDNKYERNDMVDHIIDQYHSGKLTWREYMHSSWFLFGAADKTSAEGISNLLYQLALNQDKQDKLRREVQRDGPNSEYLLWTINESMRLMPPAPLGATRRTERPLEGGGSGGSQQVVVIPKGTIVMPPIYLIHRLKEYWGDDANEFKPERFAHQKSFHPCQFMPFGLGSKQCPGKEFALHEIRLLLSRLLVRYKFTCKPKTRPGFDSPYFVFTVAHEPTYVTISRL